MVLMARYDCVVSLESVLSVITALEGATITKEQLEATRLAKYINQLRRRTKSDNLARRAKSLLKKWREMVGIQQGNDSTTVGATGSAASNSLFSPSAPNNIPDSENTVSTSQLSSQPNQLPKADNNTKQLHQPCHSQPTSPHSYVEKTNANEFINSAISNPALVSLLNQSGNLAQRNKKRLEKMSDQQPLQQQPTSFANLITGLGSSNSSSLRKSRNKCSSSSLAKPTETFIIDHSSNSNSDKVCMPSNAASTYTSAKNVPPIVIDLQDTNSSMNSFVSKDVTKASLQFSLTKPSMKKSKKEKKRKDRDILSQTQQLHDCDDNNTTSNTSYHHQRPLDMLTVEEKSHYACPTISNISEILSLSNSSMSSVFPFTDAISKNIYDSCHNELASSNKMSKSELTFAGKFKQSTSSTSTMCEVLNYKSDNVIGYSSSSPNKNKFTPFAGIGVVTNSRDSTSHSQILQFNVTDDDVKEDASNSKLKVEELQLKHKSNDKSVSNMSNKGNSSTDNVFEIAPPDLIFQQQPQSIDLTTDNLLSEQTIKQPKKRGRKKGSKGVDSVIAKETSLSSHMLISSFSAGVKKVKTTKELYAEMQNRKLHNVSTTPVSGGTTINTSPATNWPLQQQRKSLIYKRGSSCSDINESDSCTMTSEQSCDSANPSKIEKREITLDSNSNYSQFDSELKANDKELKEKPAPIIAAQATTTTNIQHQMLTILKQLAPPPSITDIEQESLTNIMPCTCTIVEIKPRTDKDNDTSEYQVDVKDFLLCATKNDTIVDENKPNEIENTNISIVSYFSNKQEDTQQQTPIKLKKSIFDLDFEDEDDPLNFIIADIIAKTSNSNNLEKISLPADDGIADNKLKTEDDALKDDQIEVKTSLVAALPHFDNIVLPTYEVKFDPDCLAKTRFDIQTQQITKFHIDSLHNCLIPNVNGNWNHADVFTSDINIIKNNNDNLDINQIIDGYRVVPCYGSEIKEHILKDLSHVKFTKKFQHNKTFTKNYILNNIPFMGVARLIGVSMKSRKPKFYYRKERNMLKRDENCFSKHKKEYSIQSETHEKLFDICSSTPVETHNNRGMLNTILIDVKSIKSETQNDSNLITSLANSTNVNCTNSEEPDTINITPFNENVITEFFEKAHELINVNLETTDNDNLNIQRNSSSSINSLKKYQHSINLKLKHQRHENKNLLAIEKSKKRRSNLKRTHKTFKEKNIHIIKRLKIAINGNPETQKQISGNSCNNTTDESTFSEDEFHSADNFSETDCQGHHPNYGVVEDNDDLHKKLFDEEQNDYNSNYHHEVVSHGVSATSSKEKHIVLTIKKTHSKSNSAVNFVSTVTSDPNKSKIKNSLEINDEEVNFKLIKGNHKIQLKHNDKPYQNVRKDNKKEHFSYYKRIFCEKPMKMPRLNFFKKKLKRKKVSLLSYKSQDKIKLHKLLFFSDEICHFIQKGARRSKEYIFNISSCSSSCSDEDDNLTFYSDKEFINPLENYYNEHNEYSKMIRSPSLSSLSSQCSESSTLKLQTKSNVNEQMTKTTIDNITSLDNDDNDHNDDDDLPLENNRMLLTFNNLCCNTKMDEQKIRIKNNEGPDEQQLTDKKIYYENMLKQPLQNCDDNLYNSKFSLIKYIDNSYSFVNNDINASTTNDFDQVYNNNSSSNRANCIIFNKRENNDLQISTLNEYNTKKRADHEIASDYEENDNSVRLEQFKEWHEVLQLRSYNDELLTVLPYVVLE